MNKETIDEKLINRIMKDVREQKTIAEYFGQEDAMIYLPRVREILEKHLLKEEEPKKDKIEIIRHPFPDGELCRAKINEIISYLNNLPGTK